MPRKRPALTVHGRNYRPTKCKQYLDWFATFIGVSRKSYQIGRSFATHKDTILIRRLQQVMSDIQQACQCRIIINLGCFFEEYNSDYGDAFNVLTFCRYLNDQRNRIPIHDRAAAFDFLGRPDAGETRPWLNRAIADKMAKHIRTGPHRKLMEAMRWNRNKNVAHRMRHNRRKAPAIRWNDILALIRVATEITKTLDKIYTRSQYHLPDPESLDSDTFKDMGRLISGTDPHEDADNSVEFVS